MNNQTDNDDRPTSLRNFYLGLMLALLSTLFIGCSFIVKKIALIRLERSGTRACEGGYGYLKDWLWWVGLILIGVGEGANFIAYAFAPASLVTPLGGLSVLVTAMLSSKFLNERLNLVGKLGCIVCLSGSTIVVLHAPKEQEIESMKDLTQKFLNPAYISYACAIIILAVVLIFYLSPRIGKSNPLVYLSISGMIGSLSVMACKGIGVGIREAFINPYSTLSSPLFWTLIIQLLVSITVQMNFLNMALDVFNTNIVTPLLYVIFTGCVLIASSLLFQEWYALTIEDHFGNICGLLCIVSGIFLITALRDMDIDWHVIRQSMKAGPGSYDRLKTKADFDEEDEEGDDQHSLPHGLRQRMLQKHTRAFSYQVDDLMTTEVRTDQPKYGALGSPRTFMNKRKHSVELRKGYATYESDPEITAHNDMEEGRFSGYKGSSAPITSLASSTGSSSPNNFEQRTNAPVAMVKPMHHLQ
ncbi:Magnesium transporter nipa2 [Cichlidogyrus casuarinus]|uniref:Magnesium transporter nipa2 n=1 Tax=Cichlidogyrus casuarinus TaxID=1844966 RepID=A0ABD2QA20_9PLAT